MSYADLYEHCQEQTVPISRKVLLPKIRELTKTPLVRFFRVDVDKTVIFGFTVWPGSTDHPIAKFCDGAPVIAVARGLDNDHGLHWDRFVVIKELMHLFDERLERITTSFEFEALVTEFGAPQPDRSLPMRSEVKCLWMAIGVLCPESLRQHLQRQRERGQISDEEISNQIRMPLAYVPHLFDQNYKATIASLLDC